MLQNTNVVDVNAKEWNKNSIASVYDSSEEGSPLLKEGLFDRMLALANVMAKSQTLPQAFHNKPGDCLRVIELAYRVKQSPYAIADWCFVIGGKLSMEGKGIAALINSSPLIDGALRYDYSGDVKKPSNYFCIVSGKRRGESESRIVKISLEQGLSDSKGARQRWEKDPDQMLAYYGSRVWARRHAPEVIGGLYTPDELAIIPPNPKAIFIENNIKGKTYIYPSVEDAQEVVSSPIDELAAQIEATENIEQLESLVPALQELNCAPNQRKNLRALYKSKLDSFKSSCIVNEFFQEVPSTNSLSEDIPQ